MSIKKNSLPPNPSDKGTHKCHTFNLYVGFIEMYGIHAMFDWEKKGSKRNEREKEWKIWLFSKLSDYIKKIKWKKHVYIKWQIF